VKMESKLWHVQSHRPGICGAQTIHRQQRAQRSAISAENTYGPVQGASLEIAPST
jgi:hypothetical protein